ncbi:MFS transporter [Eubacterium multiforme]|uniref:MFS family permease n=1 Tax=Eubacterium multiforme TaxID=83339 RepID=A0ABT9UTK6_9FIRM|nr:MFS transporter [Eubacterium multiforme]MDQ0149663.1 MFS family permease [Eubacterium multiforme]
MLILEDYKKLSKDIYIIFIVQLINRFGDFVVPFLTLFFTEKLNLPINVVGILITLISLISLPAFFLGGKLSDVIGHKKIYIIFQSISSIFLFVIPIINNKYLKILFIIISTFFNNAARPSINGIIIESTNEKERKIAFSLQYIGINLGVAIGPIVGGFLFNNYLSLIFLGDALTSLIAVVLVFFNIGNANINKDTFKYVKTNKEDSEQNLLNILKNKYSIKVVLIIYTIYSFVYCQYKFSLPITLNYKFGDSSVQFYGVLMSINAISVILFTIFINKITNKFNSITNIAIAGMFYAFGFGFIGIISKKFFFLISTLLWSIGEILISTNLNVFLANNSPSKFKARINSLGSFCMNVGVILGTFLAAKYINSFGISNFWNLIFVIALVASIILFILNIYIKRSVSK